MSPAAAMRHRDCPVCDEPARTATIFLKPSFEQSRVTAHSFASRKLPEFMTYGYVRCRRCTTVFADEAPGADEIATAYHQADYDTAGEADDAAATYRKFLQPYLARHRNRGTALEIGTGTGVFLRHLRQFGFRKQVGIEPSPAAIAAAGDDVKRCIQQGIFTGTEFPSNSLSFVCCFQTLEHVPDPRGFVQAAFRMLEPGGMLALITHDYTAWINRLLGRRSPIIDIEHLQLFNPKSLRRLITDAGYELDGIQSIRNMYPVSYWIRLLPAPVALKLHAISALERVGLARRKLGVDVGNLLTVAHKAG